MPVAYFIVCLCLQEPTPEKVEEAQGYINVLLEKHPEVKPVSQGMFAGVLDYSKLNKFLGKMMEKIEEDGGERRGLSRSRGHSCLGTGDGHEVEMSFAGRVSSPP